MPGYAQESKPGVGGELNRWSQEKANAWYAKQPWRVGCCNWGLVAGKTQTIYPWGSPSGAPEPKVWFHDLLSKDGTPFIAEEAKLLKNLTERHEK